MSEIDSLYKDRATYSKLRVTELRRKISKLLSATCYPGLTIFGAGSYARHEASQYSDIDLFLICSSARPDIEDPRTKELRLFGELIAVADELELPKFSNDCQFIKVLHTDEILSHLGSPKDDHENYFTVRMLLLLESKCLFGDDTYEKITKDIIHSYFKDYPDHENTFQPIFLMNDICRFWKTLLLNYENKRVEVVTTGDTELDETVRAENKVKQRVKNFKLKFSRMTTCFATIAALGSYMAPVEEDQVFEQTQLTPRERLLDIQNRIPEASNAISDVLKRYAWFLEKTGLPTEELNGYFRDNQQRTEMFKTANEYGDAVFELLRVLDHSNGGKSSLLRYVVI